MFYTQHINKAIPHFTFMRRAQNADTHALKQHRLSQNIFPCLLQFCTGSRIWHASRVWKRKTSEERAKNVDFHTAKKCTCTTNTFSLFLNDFLETDLRPIYSSLTTWPENRPLTEKLCGDLAGLKRAAAFLRATGKDVWRKRSTKKKKPGQLTLQKLACYRGQFKGLNVCSS